MVGRIKRLFRNPFASQGCRQGHHQWEKIEWKPELGSSFEEIPDSKREIFPGIAPGVYGEYAKYRYLMKCKRCGEEKVIERVALI